MPSSLQKSFSDARHRLRWVTRAHHVALEANPLLTRLMGPECDLPTLRRIVAAHVAVYGAMEEQLKMQMPDCLHRHRGFRFRESLARADMTVLRGNCYAIPRGPAPEFRTNAEWLGYLYVVEGASLGGQLITARLRDLKRNSALQGLQIFSPYGASTGRVWRDFLDILRAQLKTEIELAQAARAATQTFTLHNRFLCQTQEMVYG